LQPSANIMSLEEAAECTRRGEYLTGWRNGARLRRRILISANVNNFAPKQAARRLSGN
jgi:hypothetical protein